MSIQVLKPKFHIEECLVASESSVWSEGGQALVLRRLNLRKSGKNILAMPMPAI